MKLKLTQKAIETQVKGLDGNAVYLWDTELSGFGARLSPSGEVSWLVQKFIGGRGGRAVRQTIGRAKDGMELTDARKLAVSEIGDIKKGVDVLARKRELRHKVRDQMNSMRTEEAIEKFIKANGKDTRYWKDTERLLRASLSSFLKRPIIEVTKADVRKMLDDKRGRPAAQRNLFAALRPFFSFLVEHDLIVTSPVSSISAPDPLASRDRLLTDLELKALWEVSKGLSNPWGQFYRLLILTGQRIGEVSGMRWEEIDMEKALWTIPKERAKNNKAHIVHLSSQSIDELRSLSNKQEGFVFPAKRLRKKDQKLLGEGSIKGFSKSKANVDALMTAYLKEKADNPTFKLTPWRVHDLRRTMVSGLAQAGYATDVVDRLLNHVSGSQSGVKGVYQRYEFMKERREALMAWGEHVLSLT
ncbi:integrase [Phyllobacterium ifriqiyense]|uniref:Integrase n=1 Tax=Phyllobacterium ifriqiyense TaxID=314238 RepID=A0ABU0SAT3_9HYPH|nr:tyrosine-type recombinase/integrase [Phyllobacterium ifriqiyense]MDQ0997030.1 integrase [Phyllobacterium ifriqiyense]